MVDVENSFNNIEKREVTVEKTFVEIGDEEFEVDFVLEFLDKVSGSDGFVDRGFWEYKYEDLAETLLDMKIIRETASGSWYEVDDKCERMYDELSGELYEMRNA